MRLLICAGGTGGGVYPALAVKQAINNEETEILWVGSDDGMESELVHRAGIPFKGIPSAGLHGVSILSVPGRLLKLTKGFFAAKKILREWKPDVLFFTGGYVGFPVAAAGLKIPQVLFVPDIEPGMALNVLAKTAKLITVVCDDSKKYFDNGREITVTGYPVRSEMQQWDRADAMAHFDLKEGKPVLFVFGGSKGAHSINLALQANIEKLLEFCQVIHVSGTNDWDAVREFHDGLAPELQAGYHVFPYLHEDMGAAFSAADLVISRAGASTLGELPLFGDPAILVPYPYAWRYQKVNAEYLVNRGAALMIEDAMLAERMEEAVKGLLTDEAKLTEMKKNAAALACPDAAAKIAEALKEQAKK